MKCPYCGSEGKVIEPQGHTEEGLVVVTWFCPKCRRFIGEERRKLPLSFA